MHATETPQGISLKTYPKFEYATDFHLGDSIFPRKCLREYAHSSRPYIPEQSTSHHFVAFVAAFVAAFAFAEAVAAVEHLNYS